MTTRPENPQNPHDTGFLISRDIDGDLSPEQRSQLAEKLRTSPELRAEAEKLRSVDRLVARWGRRDVEIDWDAHIRLAEARIREGQADSSDEKLDAVLSRWAVREAVGDEDRFVEAVMGRVRSPVPARILRWGMPFAAAAVIALVATATLWRTVGPDPGLVGDPVAVVRIGPSVAATAASEEPVRAVVSFGRPTGTASADRSGRIALMTMGSSPGSREAVEVAPL